MKKTYFFTLLLILLATSTGKVYSETVTISVASDIWTSSGASGDGSATSVTKDGITVSSDKGYKDGTTAIREYSGSIVTISTDGTKYITSVAFTSTASGTKNYGPGKISANSNCTYSYSGSVGTATATSTTTTSLSLKCTAQFRWKSVTITYTSTCTTPTFSIENKTISLTEAETGDYDMSTNLTINKGSSTGAITYSCDNEDVDVTDGKFNVLEAGTYTITATMAADDTYCEATTTFTITVTAQAHDPLATPTGLSSANITATGATLSWSAVENATGYTVTYTGAVGSAQTVNVTGTSCTLSGLTAETDYLWTVKALGDNENYGDSDESSTSSFTTQALPTYTITWSAPDGEQITTVTQGEAVVLPTTAPTSCSDTYTQFVGWFTEAAGSEGNPSDAKPATQVTTRTVPTGDATYYAVFADEAGGGTTTTENLFSSGTYASSSITWTEVGVVSILQEKGTGATAPNSSYVTSPRWYTSNTITITPSTNIESIKITATSESYATALKGSTYTNAEASISGNVVTITPTGGNSVIKITMGAQARLSSLVVTYSSGSSASGYISTCCSDAAVVTVTPAATSLNLNESGSATTTVTCTQAGGGEGTWTYSVTPAGATFDGATFTATDAGEYTLCATYKENCGKSGRATITVTKNPVFGTATIDKNTFEVSCGDTTSMNSAAVISFGTNYNLTKTVTVTAPEGFVVSTNKTDNAQYAQSVTLTPTASGENKGKITGNVYVRACSAVARTEGYSGEITIAGDEITTQKLAVSSTVTCAEYTLQLNDRGTTTTVGDYYYGAEVPQPDDPTGVCTEPIEYVFDGWSETEVTEGAASYTKVSFPYTMPKGGATLYAVYRYNESEMSANTFKKGTLADLTDGQKVVLFNYANNVAISAKTAADTYNRSAISYTPNDETITVSENDSVIWTVTKSGSKYIFGLGDKYLGVTKTTENKTTYYQLSWSETKDTWTTATGGTGYTLISNNNSRFIDYYNSKFTTYHSVDGNAFYMHFYVPAYIYTSTPVCVPYITGTKGIRVTSAKDIWVEAADTMVVSATNLDKNDDGSAVSISAEVTSGNFTIKIAGTSNSGSKALTLATGYTRASFPQKLVVVYTPTADNTTETGQILLRAYKTNGTTEYATATIEVQGRSLPAEFVVAAKTDDGWVALPSNLGIGSGTTVKAPYAITVDDESNPTKATQAPTTALYKGAARNTANTCANAIRLQSVSDNAYLQASTAAGNTGIWLSTQNRNDAQPWKMTSTDLVDYNVRIEKAEAGRYLGYDSSNKKIANYKQVNTLRFLPVETKCNRFDAPVIKSKTPASTQVTLSWTAIAGVTEYEYSTDQTTWSAIGSVTTADDVTTAVIAGLTSSQSYTLYLRVKTEEPNCSDITAVTFTTTDCDDVPTGLTATVHTNSVTISWTATAATATVQVYSDEACTNLVGAEHTGVASPYMISGLTPNTTYYYRVLADGTCGSAIESFTTETNDISVVEWNQNEMIVNVNAEGDDVSVVVEGKVAHGDKSSNIADDLFFSKYFEAKAQLKLVAIYNGTMQSISLANTRILFSKGNAWDSANETLDLSSLPDIPSQTEYIFFSYTESRASGSAEGPAVDCVKNSLGFDHGNWFPTNQEAADDLGETLQFSEDVNLNISGDRSMALQRKENGTWKFIDLFGAGNETTAVNSTVVEKTDQIEVTLSDGSTTKTRMNDAKGWYCSEGTHYVSKTTIPLSTNRYLLIRKNTVKSGYTAVADNTEDFTTLCSEWEGAPCGKFTDTSKDNQTTCVNFAYVADFNYNNYYVSYDSIGGLDEIQGHRNADGTYTIPLERLDTLACTDIRLQVKKNGAVVASKEQRVPIMVVKSTDTQNDTLFITPHTEEECKTCDVVVRDEATLSHVTNGRKEFRNMYIYAGSRLSLPAGENFALQAAYMHAKNDSVSYAVINNDNTTITINNVVHVKRIDGKYWYPFALPYDCKISDIKEQCGIDLGTYGVDWGIKYYDGQARQQNATSADLGQVGLHWKMMPSDGVLQANTGYIIGLFYPDENLMRSIYFTPNGSSTYIENTESKETSIYSWADNLTADARHHGWNFVGSPYISLFGETTAGQGLYNNNVKMGYTDTETGEQKNTERVYVSIPDGANTNTYTQALASATTLRPFTAYFVQSIDPTDGSNKTLTLTYNKSYRYLQAAPARTQATERSVLAELRVTNNDHTLCDNAGILVGSRYTADYEIGDDLLKMYAAENKPQLYTNDATYGKMAYLAIPDALAHNISLGLYVPQAGDYTLSLNETASDISGAEAVYLLYQGAVVANLLHSDYTVSAANKGTVEGYGLDIRRTPQVVTEDISANGDNPQILYRDGILYLDNLTTGAEVYVYDVLGRLLLNTTASGTIIEIPAVQTGVYTVLMRTAESQRVLKTLLR